VSSPNGVWGFAPETNAIFIISCQKDQILALVNLLFLGDQIEVKVAKHRSVKKMCHIKFILYFLTKLKFLVQWRRQTRACQGKCPSRNTSALAVKSGNNKVICKYILTAIADATNDLSKPCHEQRQRRSYRGADGYRCPRAPDQGGAKTGLD